MVIAVGNDQELFKLRAILAYLERLLQLHQNSSLIVARTARKARARKRATIGRPGIA